MYCMDPVPLMERKSEKNKRQRSHAPHGLTLSMRHLLYSLIYSRKCLSCDGLEVRSNGSIVYVADFCHEIR